MNQIGEKVFELYDETLRNEDKSNASALAYLVLDIVRLPDKLNIDTLGNHKCNYEKLLETVELMMKSTLFPNEITAIQMQYMLDSPQLKEKNMNSKSPDIHDSEAFITLERAIRKLRSPNNVALLNEILHL